MSDEEQSLIATRKRRANAGSRLKQLLKAEEQTGVMDEDEDEDLDLLFQEDDDDDEFKLGDKDRYYGSANENQSGDSDRSDEEDADDSNSDDEGKQENDNDDSEAEVLPDNDEMFSDSDSESESEDSDVGEKELAKQERAKKRLQQKKAKQIPKIKQRVPSKSDEPKKPKKVYSPAKADTLLSLERRQSSRKAVVENKLNLVEKLKDEEKRRSSLKPIQKIEYVELTQEERLAEAIETEKFNISTLNKYQEQELDKQMKRRALQLSKRKKLENIVSFKTCEKFVTILEEHELEKFLLTRDKIKKKDRRGRKSDKQKREEEEARQKELKRQEKLKSLMHPIGLPEATTSEEPPTKKVKTDDGNTDITENVVQEDIISEDADLSTKPKETPELEDKSIKIEESEKQDNLGVDITEGDLSKSVIEPTPDVEMTDATADDETKSIKTVTFEEDIISAPTPSSLQDESKLQPSSRESTAPLDEFDAPEIKYEGPEQKVGVNYISFEKNLKISELRTFLFGEDSLLSASRRFLETEPLLRIKADPNVSSNSKRSTDLPSFEILSNFPKFGDFNAVKKDKIIIETRQDQKIVLKTEASTGIFLPNGTRKQCLITGKPAMYFDPKSGMPYSDVESYKIVQRIQDGGFNWCEFPGGGAYVFDREFGRHAKGVPEGFDE